MNLSKVPADREQLTLSWGTEWAVRTHLSVPAGASSELKHSEGTAQAPLVHPSPTEVLLVKFLSGTGTKQGIHNPLALNSFKRHLL